MQATFINSTEGSLTLTLSNNGQFFKDKLEESTEKWKPLILEQFPSFKTFVFNEVAHPQPLVSTTPKERPNIPNSNNTGLIPTQRNSGVKKRFTPTQRPKEQLVTINVSDKAKWPVSNLIINHFPGKIVKGKISI